MPPQKLFNAKMAMMVERLMYGEMDLFELCRADYVNQYILPSPHRLSFQELRSDTLCIVDCEVTVPSFDGAQSPGEGFARLL